MSIQTLSTRVRRAALLAVPVGAVLLFASGASTQGPRFYPDDPIARAPESQDASKAAEYETSLFYDLTYNLFVTGRSYEPTGRRAQNLNTIDEVPDSSWFTNRVGTKPITTEDSGYRVAMDLERSELRLSPNPGS